MPDGKALIVSLSRVCTDDAALFATVQDPNVYESSYMCRPIIARAGDQTSPVLRSIVLITESIFPLNTCLARLRVKPVTAWKGRCDGSDSA